MSGPVPSEQLVVQVLMYNEAAAAYPADAGAQECGKGTDVHRELTPEDASCMAVTAVAADLEYWARTVSVGGRVGLNDLTRVLDGIRSTSTLG
jgi:hypothetical protein